uniref:Uncharacterized protein n=1 Tax=Manihot esculenta TaxID=3983 RepID=A0A2C9WDJ7_MANES
MQNEIAIQKQLKTEPLLIIKNWRDYIKKMYYFLSLC